VQIREVYQRVAVFTFTAALGCGVLALGVLSIRAFGSAPEISVFARYGQATIESAYPGWSTSDLRALLAETHTAMVFEPFTQYREAPRSGRYVNVHEAGFRVSTNQSRWPPAADRPTVFVFGGSTTFGYGVPDSETIPSNLQQRIDEVQVYNFGRSGYFSSGELALFQSLARQGFVPTVAVFIDGLNEFVHWDGKPLFTDRLAAFVAGTREPSLFGRLWGRLAGTSLPPAVVSARPDPDVAISRWRLNKRFIDAVSRDLGVVPVFVWQPVPSFEYGFHFLKGKPAADLVSGGSADFVRTGYEAFSTARGAMPDVIWLAELQKDRSENLYVDQVHYSGEFSRDIALKLEGPLRAALASAAARRRGEQTAATPSATIGR